MNESSNQESLREHIPIGRYPLIGGIAAALLYLLATFAPESWRTWGVDSLAFTTLPYRLVWIAGAGLLATGIALAAEWGRETKRWTMWALFLWLVAVVAVSLVLPDATHLRGDGILLHQHFQQSSLVRLRAPLTAILYGWLRDLFHLRDAVSSYRLYDFLSLAIYFVAVWLLVRRYNGNLMRWTAGALLTLNGALLLMSGMIEYYAPVYAVAALSLAVSLRAMDRGKYPIAGLVLALVASGLHFLAAVLLPAFLFPLLPRLGKARTLILFTLLAVAGVVAGILLFPENMLWPLGPSERDALTLYDPRHLLDLLNLLFWAMPASMLLLPLALKGEKGEHPLSDPVEGFLMAGTLGAFGFALAFSPDLGMARDADLLSLVAVPGSLWILHRLGRHPSRFTPALLALVIFTGTLGTVGQLAVHSNETQTISRFKRMLVRDPERSAYGWEALGIYYRITGNDQGEYEALQKAARYSSNWRYYVRLADIAKDQRKLDVAEGYIRKALEYNPNDASSLYTLGHIQVLKGQRAQGIASLNRCLEQRTNIVAAYSLMGYLLFEEGKYLEAEDVMLRGSKNASYLDGLYYATFTIIENRLGKHAAARKLYDQINPDRVPRLMLEEAKAAYQNSLQSLRDK